MPLPGDIALAAGVGGLFGYYVLRERWTSVADRSRTQHRPTVQRGIRLLVIVAVIFLVVQAFGLARTPFPLTESIQSVLIIFGHLLFWFGAFLVLWARETLGHNWAHAADYQVIPGQQLVRHGPYRFVRHPIYTALLLIFPGAELALGSWLVVLAVPLFWLLSWQAGREEALLRRSFREYNEYAQSLGRFFPKIGRA